ncbi:MAG: ZIP family metal transporter [Lachnospiraceae bacterium]|nr:ZIP family metal transporter [Lachnospiraceae bacterium]
MNMNVIVGLLIPFIGTTLGAMMVLFMRKEINNHLQRVLTGFAAGVMVSASFWSLLIPAVEQAKESMGKTGVIPVVVGFCFGMLFLLLIDTVIPHMHLDESVEGLRSGLKKTTMLVLAVVIHNIPEGMAVGVLYAGWMQGNAAVSFSAAVSLAVGIAIQNFPEGAIISMPLHANGMSKGKAFLQGTLSGVVEPVAGCLTILLASQLVPWMPVLLSFAAGAMIYVVVEELIPEMAEGEHSNTATLAFMLGFAGMMMLDILFG